MKENPFASPEPAPEEDHEKRSHEQAKILSNVAREHLDELLPAEDYAKFGLDKLNPIDVKDFEWSVYVNESDGRKRVGNKIIGENGLYDMREFDANDQSLPVSTKQGAIDEIIAQRSKLARERREKGKLELTERMDKERGFPEGKYILNVTYPHRSGVMKTMDVHDITVRTGDTRDDVFNNAKSWIELTGLHNFGLDHSKGSRDTGVLIKAFLKKDGTEVPFELAVDPSGHIVREQAQAK